MNGVCVHVATLTRVKYITILLMMIGFFNHVHILLTGPTAEHTWHPKVTAFGIL